MDEIEEITKDYKNRSNKDLIKVMEYLNTEFNITKTEIIKMTYYLDSVESTYNSILKEYSERNNGIG